ncbi:putative ribonuclease H-like domain-containing protein [Tanacetum coccineum]
MWRNKAELETMSMDDLYNNLKVYEPEVKGMSSSSSSHYKTGFCSSSNNNTGSSNKAVNAAHGVTTASTQVNTAYSTNIDNLSDASSKKSRQQEQEKHKKEVSSEHQFHSFVSCDGLVYDWSDQAEERPNYALITHLQDLTQRLKTDEFVNKPVVENRKSDEEVSKVVRKSDDSLIIKDWVQIEEENVNAARPMSYLSKTAHSTVKRPIHKNTTFKNSNIDQSVNTVSGKKFNTARPKAVVNAVKGNNFNAVKASACWGNPQIDLQDHGVIDSGCSRHMIRNMSYLTNYEEIDGGYVAFGGNPKGEKITRKCTIKTGNLDFENVYFMRELKFNLFSVSQMCDKKNSVLFNDTECIVLSPNFKLIDESQVLLRVPRKNNMYSVDLKNIVPKGGLTCLFAKATFDESKLWHRRLGHLNFKTMNKLVKGNLVRGLPSKLFENDQTCVACQKGKQHKASCKSKTENSISLPLHLLHMDLFGPTFVKSLMKKMYCLVVTDDYSRFTWVFFLATKDETSGILKSFITGIENLVDHKVKVIRCDNGTEFKNREMNQFCEIECILRQFSVARTPQQNRVAERRNKTLIEAAGTMLADSNFANNFFGQKQLILACYAQNRVSLGKLIGKADEGTQSNGFAGTKASDNACQARKETEPIPNLQVMEWKRKVDEDPRKDSKCNDLEKEDNEEPKKVIHALKDPSWIEAIQEELLEFKL